MTRAIDTHDRVRACSAWRTHPPGARRQSRRPLTSIARSSEPGTGCRAHPALTGPVLPPRSRPSSLRARPGRRGRMVRSIRAVRATGITWARVGSSLHFEPRQLEPCHHYFLAGTGRAASASAHGFDSSACLSRRHWTCLPPLASTSLQSFARSVSQAARNLVRRSSAAFM